jgi:glycosyltransferase involved in cell wall biosynthesis
VAAPELTVVIPTRDRWEIIGPSLAGALRQEDVDLEVVVVDDGSRAPAPQGAALLSDERVTLVRLERPCGVAAARNVGIARARGRWVAFLDDDDLWSPRKLRIQLDAASDAGASFAYSGAVVVDTDLDVLTEYIAPNPSTLVRDLLRVNAMPGGASNVIALTDVLRGLDGFDEGFAHLDDWDLWIRLADSSPGAACEDPLVAYVQHEGNRLLQDEGTVLREFSQLRAKHRERSARYGTAFDGADYTRWVAHAYRRAGRRWGAVSVYMRGAIAYRSPGNVIRGLVTIAGEGAMRRLAPRNGAENHTGAPPAWLSLYRGAP